MAFPVPTEGGLPPARNHARIRVFLHVGCLVVFVPLAVRHGRATGGTSAGIGLADASNPSGSVKGDLDDLARLQYTGSTLGDRILRLVRQGCLSESYDTGQAYG